MDCGNYISSVSFSREHKEAITPNKNPPGVIKNPSGISIIVYIRKKAS